MEILADDSVTITSSNDEIHISAKDTIVLKAGQSSVILKGGDITFACPGTFSVKGAGNAFEGPGSGSATLSSLPVGHAGRQEAPLYKDAIYTGQYELFKVDNRPFAGYDYEIRSNRSGKVLASGKTSDTGLVDLVTTEQEERISAYKSVMRETERITEDWQGKLAAAAAAAKAKS
jgi:type VI secretion system secreted protein VgrG